MRASRLVEQFEDLDKQSHAARFGMWVFLASEILLFGPLFALYASYRTMYPASFARAVARGDVAIGTTNTLILITSSFTVVLALWALRIARNRLAGYLLVFSIACGLGFLALKGVEYAEHFREGIFPGAAYRNLELPSHGAKMFFTIYYVATGLHAIHVTAGLSILAWLAVGAFRGDFSAKNHVRFELGTLYWHLVDVLWIFLWPLFYLLHD